LYFCSENELLLKSGQLTYKKLRSGTMKALLAVAAGVMLVVVMAFASSNLAFAAPGGHGKHHGGHHGHHGKHHGWHHRGHWGYGPSFIMAGGECYTVKRCRVNEFGEKRCRWVEECD
jgi:hypothetical protein